METTTNSIAACAANTSARGQFGIKNVTSGRCPNFKPNRHVAGIESAQSAIEFVAPREKLQSNTSLADPAKGLRSLASWDATSYISIIRTKANAQPNLIGGEAEAGFNDIIYGSASGSRMQGLGGNDASGVGSDPAHPRAVAHRPPAHGAGIPHKSRASNAPQRLCRPARTGAKKTNKAKTANSIALCAVFIWAGSRFGLKYTSCEIAKKYKPTRSQTHINTARSATEFVVIGGVA